MRLNGDRVDLGTIDIARDRERGVPRYNDFRERLRKKRITRFEDLTDDPELAEEIRDVYDDDIDRVDLQVGMLAEPLPPGFGFSDTAFRIFILMASRRLKSDRFFTNDYSEDVYTPEGLAWVEGNSMVDLLAAPPPRARRRRSTAARTRSRPGAGSPRRVSSPSDASLLENARFNALVIVPNAVQGVFRRRRAAVAVATAANVDGQAVGLLAGMRRGHHGGPVWVRVVRDRALLLLSPADVHRALEGSPDSVRRRPEAEARRDGRLPARCADDLAGRELAQSAHVQRGGARHRWAARRPGRPLRRGSPPRRRRRSPPRRADDGGGLGWEAWNEGFRRMTRRVVLGDGAADDAEVSETLAEMMGEANGMPGKHLGALPGLHRPAGRVRGRRRGGQPGRPVRRRARRRGDQAGGADPPLAVRGGDTLAINGFRALALLASHARQRERALADDGYLEGCLEEAMRLWPTTTMLSRETLAETEWGGVAVPAGAQVLIPNLFLHRDRERHDYADRFAPERWVDGTAAGDWSFNHFSRGPQGCPGAAIALAIGKSALATVLRDREVELVSPPLDPGRPLPHMLDFFGVRVRLS